MSKKDYIQFARIIRGKGQELKYKMDNAQSEGEKLFLSGCGKMLSMITDDIMTHFQYDNPNFDSDKFLRACELPVEPA